MPKLVYVVTEDWYFVSHRLALAVSAKESGYDVTVVTRCSSHKLTIEEAGLRMIPFAMNRRGLNPIGLLWEAIQLAAIYRRLQPDIVHHVAIRPIFVGAIAARLAGIRRVASAVAGMGYLFTGRRSGSLVGKCVKALMPFALGRGLAIVQNPDDAATLESCGIARDCIRCIPGSGVDVDKFLPAPEPPGEPVVMMASRILWDKGVSEFIEAAELLKKSGTVARFVLVGDPDPANPASVPVETIQKWIKDSHVECWGHKSNMPQILPQAHIVCLPSYREGFPKILLEAMACGRACITTDVTGCREAVRHGENGILIPAKNGQALADAIQMLINSPLERARMGAKGRSMVISEFNQEAINRRTFDIYDELSKMNLQ